MKVRLILLCALTFSLCSEAVAQTNATSPPAPTPCQGLFGQAVATFGEATELVQNITDLAKDVREKDMKRWEGKVDSLVASVNNLQDSIDNAWPKLLFGWLGVYILGKIMDHAYLFYFAPRMAEQIVAIRALRAQVLELQAVAGHPGAGGV